MRVRDEKARVMIGQLDLLPQTTHEDRVEIDREVERVTGKNCDEGVKELTQAEFVDLVKKVLERRKKKKKEELAAYA